MHLSPAELDAYTRKVLEVCVDVTLAPSSNISSAFRTLNAVTNAFLSFFSLFFFSKARRGVSQRHPP